MARMLRKSKTLGYAACTCVQCRSEVSRVKRMWRRIARRKEEREWKKIEIQ